MSLRLTGEKQAMRARLKEIIALISPEKRKLQSRIVCDKVLSNEHYKRSSRISVFLSTDREVDTMRIVEDIFASGKECFIPKYDRNSRQMDMVKLPSLEALKELPLTSWNIRQPSDDDETTYEEALETGGLHLILVPGLAFTKLGHRIGFGRGYYDAYLQKCLKQATQQGCGGGNNQECPYAIGIGLAQQIVDSIPVEPHDVQLDEVLHPSEDDLRNYSYEQQ